MEQKVYENLGNVERGDVVFLYGVPYTVGDVLYQTFWEDSGYEIEFTSPKGKLLHWKQNVDGGYFVKGQYNINN
jgi:hypothetical protein